MKNKTFLLLDSRLFIVGFVFAVLAIFTAVPASAGGCAKFPSVPWWAGTTHTSVKNYVRLRSGGNWTPYIKKWEGQLKFLIGVYSKGGTAVVANYRLKGPTLKQYIQKVSKRVSISRCLAGEAKGDIPTSKRVD